ncbi:4-(cytidine 5'-diphospho)-2-C-methyl-D-erythritol kinase [Candidatus Peregrinibacteria bacterium CG_4_10_14_0_2_um_filter_38_24]|nr:MAG: 4-(cytidine 5'-diphospho)-2-C-methyl-D-erythritol kinase [Candidatus Peregrinibacteria bacterium CG_4_10_14_0_2_um_filter_38_24]PJC38662.1 MAG: 4-(cytidine 5'-diphospho)-2-C-methyl-D-erythritol kinase [Candidatus Peregrinibacteria bacterium CG_4_9_14_0_2_um_filter_38_9]
MKITAYAKVNLCLDILEKTPSGYHEIRTIFHEIKNFKDILEINKTKLKDEVSIAHDLKKSPDQKGKTEIKLSENLAKKALDLLKKTFNIKDFVSIKIHKNIPISSGLGGASSDAAAVLKGLSELFKLNLSEKRLLYLAEQIGMDVPFFIVGGTALGTHFGEKITKLSEINSALLNVKIFPKSSELKEKTRKAYENLDLSKYGQNKAKTELVLKGIETGDKKLIIENLHNDFETSLKKPLQKNVHLSGSGPSVFTCI